MTRNISVKAAAFPLEFITAIACDVAPTACEAEYVFGVRLDVADYCVNGIFHILRRRRGERQRLCRLVNVIAVYAVDKRSVDVPIYRERNVCAVDRLSYACLKYHFCCASVSLLLNAAYKFDFCLFWSEQRFLNRPIISRFLISIAIFICRFVIIIVNDYSDFSADNFAFRFCRSKAVLQNSAVRHFALLN